MPIIAAIVVALFAPSNAPPPCRAGQLRSGIAPRTGVADFAPVSGALITIRNRGSTCLLPSSPTLALLDRRGRPLSAQRRAPPGMHPGPVMVPLTLHTGEAATIEVTWPYCPAGRACLRIGGMRLRFGPTTLKANAPAVIPAAPDEPFHFDQPPARSTGG